jgi:uncharacterized membrane protein YciS (DUF1049 family)
MKGGFVFLSVLVLFSLSVASQESANISFNGTIAELNLSVGTNNQILDLTDNFIYNETENTTIEFKYKPGGNGLEGLIVEISSKGNVNIEAAEPGLRSVIFVVDDDVKAVESNEVNLIVIGEVESKISFSPNSLNVNFTKGSSQTFAVSGGGNASVEWYLDNLKQNETGSSYIFSGTEAGTYNVRAVFGVERKEWLVSVLEEVVEPVASPPLPVVPEVQGPVCGNGIRERGETCSSCASDVSCSENTECISGSCILKKNRLNLVLWLVLVVAVAIAIVVGVILLRKKMKQSSLKEGNKSLSTQKDEGKPKEEKEGFFGNLLSKIKGIFKKKEDKKEVKPTEEKVKRTESVNLNPLVMYFKMNMGKYKKEVLAKQALGQGWKKEQIDKVLAKLGKGNDNVRRDTKSIGKK